ncbi:MAG: ATP synthase F1 subunit gamma [Verrucomicrobiales bacterium]|nr:ATP synthase F1 subunit gamma [Verrucomicrobiales bacterium]|tara:strand:+ start:7887 stop:8780 length:894 start_codon:yes stop_codon:yes gene_type:complete
MPSTRDIRRRIKSVKNTSQITKAMQMVAASKMRKAQDAALAGRPYAEQMNAVMAEVTANVGDFTHPLMEQRENKAGKRGLVVVSSDKGLCGALNTNLLREVAKYDAAATVHITAGRKASQYVARSKRELAAEFTYKDAPEFSEARQISKFAQDLFLEEKVDSVDILYTDFINTLTQQPTVKNFLPVGEITALDADMSGESEKKQGELEASATEFLFEPSAEGVLGALLPHYLNYQVYQVLLESKASEHSARMVAMKNATDNAKELIKDLTLQYNKLRQANITSELLEITTAQMALGN